MEDLPSIVCINLNHREDKWQAIRRQASKHALSIQRWEAIDGSEWKQEDTNVIDRKWDSSTNAKYSSNVTPGTKTMTDGEVGCALSHISIWREATRSKRPFLVLEDDVCLYERPNRPKFRSLVHQAWEVLCPQGTGILYLGFSSRGERVILDLEDKDAHIQLYRPEYGYHTHGYIITSEAAATLLENLPVSGPLDVWLADNQWFGLNVCCAVVPGEGWKLDDGTFEGALLVRQARKCFKSDVPQSAKKHAITIINR